MKKSTKLSVGFGLIVVALIIFVLGNFGETMQYYVTVDEMYGSLEKLRGTEFKLAGDVVEGSLEQPVEDKPVYHFVIHSQDKQVSVIYSGLAPDTFSDKSSVVVTGFFNETDQIFEAHHLLAKCASKYEAKIDGV